MKLILLLALSFGFAATADQGEIDHSAPLKEFVAQVHTYINDSNITTGTSTVTYQKTSGLNDLERFAKDKLAEESGTTLGRPEVDELQFPAAIGDIAYDLGIANAFTMDSCSRADARRNPLPEKCENILEYKTLVEVIVEKMGHIRQLNVMRAVKKIERNGDLVDAMLTVIHDTRSREVVWFYAVEGSI